MCVCVCNLHTHTRCILPMQIQWKQWSHFCKLEERKEIFHLTTHSTHFIFWAHGTTQIAGYSFQSTDWIAHTMAYITPVVEHWLEGEIVQHDRSDNTLHHDERTLYNQATSHSSVNGYFLETEFLTGRKEGNVLFNNALNTFYLRLYGIRHMVKDHSDSEKGNPLPPHRLLFLINSNGSFICTIPQTG